jgi:exosome complex RNA-binding protein Rrp42 (RNase PH superfamily)
MPWVEGMQCLQLVRLTYYMLKFRVSAKVSAEVVRPRADKPTEGLLLFNTEISPMASPAFETGR